MRKTLLGVALLVLPLAACKKTGENEYQVKTPDVNVSTWSMWSITTVAARRARRRSS